MAARILVRSAFADRLARLTLLLSLAMAIAPLADSARAQSSDSAVVSQGEAVVTGFSGAHPIDPVPQGVDPAAVTFIDLAGPSARVLDLRNAGGPPQAQTLTAPKPFTVTAAGIGQVFAVALDKANPPNVYLAATSSYGLPIVLPALTAGAPPQRLAEGAPGAAFMPGLFGPSRMQGGPGSIWRIDGASGQVALFANVALDGTPNSGPALGGLAFDPVSSNLYVADRDTGMIHRFAPNGAELGHYDHGKDGRAAAGLAPVAFDPAKRLDISSPNFHSQDPASWAYAPMERRVFGLAVHGGRLYYAVADGLRIWSIATAPDGAFGSDARIEIQVPPGDSPSEISKIVFDDRGRMILAERGAPTGAFDFRTIAQPAESRVLRYRLVQTDGKSAATWQEDPDENAIGFAGELRNTNGGAAIGYSYRPDGSLDTASCGGFLWATGEQLRNPRDPALAAELAKSGPLALNGLHGNAIEAVRPDNVPPLQSLFANYFDDSGDPALHGHLGDIAIPRGCGQSALAIPVPVTLIPWWPGGPPALCPDGFVGLGRLCRIPAPRCPVGERGHGVQCCPQGMAPGVNGECEPLRGANFNCPIGAAQIQRPDGSIQCGWLARCPDGAQADPRGGCGHFCPPGQTAWRAPKCCAYGEIGLPDGQCCPERDAQDGKCMRGCPADSTRLGNGQCCPDRDVRDGQCAPACPTDNTRLASGRCCPDRDIRDGQCAQPCPNGEPRDSNGRCGRAPQCPPGQTTGRDNLCHHPGGGDHCAPGQTRMNGACVTIPRRRVPAAQPPMCPPGAFATPYGDCAPNAPPPSEYGPRAPYEPMGPPVFRPRFPGYAGPWMSGPRRGWRPGGGWGPRGMGRDRRR